PGPVHPKRARGTVESPGCPSSVSPTVAPYSPSARPYAVVTMVALRRRDRSCVDAAFDQQSPDDTAILLARATVTSIFGLRANISASHDPLGAPRRLAWRTTALAPSISRRRMVRSPRFETAPSFCLPSVDFSSGVSPSQAAKLRTAGKLWPTNP